MRKNFLILLISIISLSSFADRQKEFRLLLNSLGNNDLIWDEVYDTIVPYGGYEVHLIRSGKKIEHIGLNLFSKEIKETIDKEILDFVETALLAKVANIEIDGNPDFLVMGGELTDLKKIDPLADCKISNLNSRYVSFEWNLDAGRELRIDFPISYTNVKGGTRGEIEDEFIKKIKLSNAKRNNSITYEVAQLKPFKENEFVLPGNSFINEEITRNIYFTTDSIPSPVWNVESPIESISNLFIYPLDEIGIKNIELTVLKHEYGEKETFTTNVENLLAIVEDQGCWPYWGLESYDGRTLTGSLFLYNWKQGYDHVLKIECIPEEVIAGNGVIKAQASLFIPANNIETLFSPEDNLTLIK